MDFLLENNGDLKIADGDFAMGDSTLQEVYLVIESKQGEWKEHPLLGVGIDDFLLDENEGADAERAILEGLEADDKFEVNVDIENGALKITL